MSTPLLRRIGKNPKTRRVKLIWDEVIGSAWGLATHSLTYTKSEQDQALRSLETINDYLPDDDELRQLLALYVEQLEPTETPRVRTFRRRMRELQQDAECWAPSGPVTGRAHAHGVEASQLQGAAVVRPRPTVAPVHFNPWWLRAAREGEYKTGDIARAREAEAQRQKPPSRS